MAFSFNRPPQTIQLREYPEIRHTGMIDITTHETVTGSGTVDDPWVGCEQIPDFVDGGRYYGPYGKYKTTETWDMSYQLSTWEFEQGAEIMADFHGTGSNSIVRVWFNGPGIINAVNISGMILNGKGGTSTACEYGIWEEASQHAIWRNIEIRNVSLAGYIAKWVNYNTYERIRLEHHEYDPVVQAQDGVIMQARTAPDLGGVFGGNYTASLWISPIIGGVSRDGMRIQNGKNVTVLGGVCGDNGRHGVVVFGNSQDVEIANMDNEANNIASGGGCDFRVEAGASNVTFRNCLGQVISQYSYYIDGDNCTIDRGSGANIMITANAHNTELRGALTAYQTGAGLTDNGVGTFGWYYIFPDTTTRVIVP